MTVINFYSTKDQYGGFSNFSRHPFELDGKQWLTTEHYFQAQKFPGNEAYQEKIRLDVKLRIKWRGMANYLAQT
ncbi:MAG: hypothetical protein K2Y32_20940 [Candidatus Obscuribacterales bacterium]|nr:hypothetical protein [Candidatus Obscuribacterales bacterium]